MEAALLGITVGCMVLLAVIQDNVSMFTVYMGAGILYTGLFTNALR